MIFEKVYMGYMLRTVWVTGIYQELARRYRGGYTVKIVVIEDENSIRNGLVRMLPKLKDTYEVAGCASDGKEGLEVVSRTRPDLVIMDIQMPRMNGLEMLEILREKHVDCRIIVLTAYSDFTYAKKAIDLGIENYLLKPIKIPELQRTLEMIERSLMQEWEQEKLQERLLSLEQIFRGCMLAELPVEGALNQITREKYSLDIREPLVVFGIWLDEGYQSEAASIQQLMEECTGRTDDYRSVVLVSSKYQAVMTVLYQMRDKEKVKERYGKSVLPVVSRNLKDMPVFTWVECDGLEQLPAALTDMLELRKWNLSYPEGTMLSSQLVKETRFLPLKYPISLEVELRQAAALRQDRAVVKVMQRFVQYCREEPHEPWEIHEAIMRFAIYIISILKSIGAAQEVGFAQSLIARMTQSQRWKEIENILQEFAQALSRSNGDTPSLSPLVKQAQHMIKEYYSQGITLEEIARKLHVSEEYLSAQFKKETGVPFRDTIRDVRMKRVKELLLHSSLKLNQIADMVGYSDPKYMSKVFKEETGMLPAEFRKING